MPKPDVSDRWIQQLRRTHKTTQSWGCIYCLDRRVFTSKDSLWTHAQSAHHDQLPPADSSQDVLDEFKKDFIIKSDVKRIPNDDRKPVFNAANDPPQPEPPPTKRPLDIPSPLAPIRTLSGLDALAISTPNSDDVTMKDVSESDRQQTADSPRKRQVTGDGISTAGSMSPYREKSPEQVPRMSKNRPKSAPYGAASDDLRRSDGFERVRPVVAHKQLWTADQTTSSPKANVDPSNVATIQARKNRAHPPAAISSPSQSSKIRARGDITPQVASRSDNQPSAHSPKKSHRQPQDEVSSMQRQPETRPISQEQLVAEVKGIYAGLVMVEARCIEVDTKHASLTQGDSKTQPKISNEQWQALIALHRTLLHEHHDFFLASQHPSANDALRRLASKYAMPARMWRHGIHSFLELLRHRLPGSIDHMLSFIYLAYSMMALLYETVEAFEDTWIECLGDLARYRMAIEEEDIRDREVWTGVARQWYSKASNNAATTGRLYHHLAILARPNALQQLFYYSKSLCVEIPFTSARESILTLFEPVLNATNPAQYRLPPLETAFIKAHGVLFTGKNLDRFNEPAGEFIDLLDAQIGRVTRKFMEQGYFIEIANCAALLDFASPHSVMMKAIAPLQNKPTLEHVALTTAENTPISLEKFKLAEKLHNQTLDVVLQRIGDPNVLPFLHATLVWLFYVSGSEAGMDLIKDNLPWQPLSIMLNTLVGSCRDPDAIEAEKFPLSEKDERRPLPEDDAMRGLLWAVPYYPDDWFENDKIDEDEKYREVASMTQDRKDRILWLACKFAKRGRWLYYADGKFSVSPNIKSNEESYSAVAVASGPQGYDISLLDSRASTFASATTVDSTELQQTRESTAEHEDNEDAATTSTAVASNVTNI